MRHGRCHVAIAGLEQAGIAFLHRAIAGDGFDAHHMAPGVTTKSTGVHGQRTTQGARYTGEPTGGTQVPTLALPRDTRARHARFDIDLLTATLLQHA